MPKIVDHEARRKELAEAAWRVIRREGLEGASVRNVAKEAGMSLGSLRHYFATQSELLAFSMRMVGERVKERIKKTGNDGRYPRRFRTDHRRNVAARRRTGLRIDRLARIRGQGAGG